MRIKWHNIFALGAILVLIVVLGQVGEFILSFFEALSDNSYPRHRSPEQIVGLFLFMGLFIAGLFTLNVYLNIKDR